MNSVIIEDGAKEMSESMNTPPDPRAGISGTVAPRAGMTETADLRAAMSANPSLKRDGVATANRLDRLYTTLEARIEARLRDALAASRADGPHAVSPIALAPLSLLDSIVERETVRLCEKEGRLRRAGDPPGADLVHLARLKVLPRVTGHVRARLIHQRPE